MKLFKYTAISAALALGLVGCGGDSGGDGGNVATGKFSLAVSDAPLDGVSSVVVFYKRAVLLPQDGGTPIEFDLTSDENPNGQNIDLLNYTGSSVAPLVTDEEVPAGKYQLCLFAMDGLSEQDDTLSYVVEGEDKESGAFVPLQVKGDGACPQGVGKDPDTGVLFFNKAFTINTGNNDFVAEFDLRRGLKEPKGKDNHYTIQRTSVQLINNIEAGHIQGIITPEVVLDCGNGDSDSTVNAVYVYEGVVEKDKMAAINAVVTAVEGGPVIPLTSADATYNDDSDVYEYEVGFLAKGTYSLGYTCTADKDTFENISDFSIYDAQGPIAVEPLQTQTVDFDQVVTDPV